MMKRYLGLFTTALLLCHPVAAPASSMKEETGKELTVVTTIFMLVAFLRIIWSLRLVAILIGVARTLKAILHCTMFGIGFVLQ